MKSTDILDAIGKVDDNCIKKAKEKKKSHKRIWIAAASLAACLVLFVCLPAIFGSLNHMGNDAPLSQNDNQGSGQEGEIVVETDDIWIYYVDGSEIKQEQQYLPMSAEDVFHAWREKNGIGSEVQFINVKIDSNGKTTVENGMAGHEIGDRFIYNLTISKNIENYYDTIDSELLLESLKQTMTGYSGLEYDEYNLILE